MFNYFDDNMDDLADANLEAIVENSQVPEAEPETSLETMFAMETLPPELLTCDLELLVDAIIQTKKYRRSLIWT